MTKPAGPDIVSLPQRRLKKIIIIGMILTTPLTSSYIFSTILAFVNFVNYYKKA